MLRRLLKHLIIRLSGPPVVKAWVDRLWTLAAYLMGVGSGDNPATSGELSAIGLLRRLPRDGPALVLFDVGANRGDFLALALSGLQDREVVAHAFEPSSAAYRDLCGRFGGRPGINLRNFGLSSRREERPLFYDREGSGLATLHRRRLDHVGVTLSRTELVCLDTLDDYARANDIRLIHLLKVDVEGHELEVLAGGRTLFACDQVMMVLFEFGGCHVDTRTFLRDFYDFFEQHRMRRLYRVTPSGRMHLLGPWSERYEQFQTANYLALADWCPFSP